MIYIGAIKLFSILVSARTRFLDGPKKAWANENSVRFGACISLKAYSVASIASYKSCDKFTADTLA